jgi:hypothetical protein
MEPVTDTCSSGCPAPPEPHVPWPVELIWRLYTVITWPLYVRQLKRLGFRRTGWMKWEIGHGA